VTGPGEARTGDLDKDLVFLTGGVRLAEFGVGRDVLADLLGGELIALDFGGHTLEAFPLESPAEGLEFGVVIRGRRGRGGEVHILGLKLGRFHFGAPFSVLLRSQVFAC
jgi:hypothetical protein